MAKSNLVNIEPLQKHNFDTWAIQMKAILIKNDLWAYVDGSIQAPDKSKDDFNEWFIADQKAQAELILHISPTELKQIKHCNTAVAIWIKLKEIYQSTGPARKATLMKKLIVEKMIEGESVQEHLKAFFDTVDKLADMSIDINPELICILLLYSLPASYETFRCVIESRDQLPTPEALRIKIIEECDARKRNHVSETSSKALYSSNIPYKCTVPVHKGRKQKTNSGKCFRCGSRNHKIAQCVYGEQKGKIRSQNSMYAYQTNDSDIQLNKHNWCLDSGATAHLCHERNMFVKFSETNESSLRMANDTSTNILGKGEVPLNTKLFGHPTTIMLKDVLYVPGLRTNLLSVKQIVDKGYKVTFNKFTATIKTKQGQTIAKAIREGNLFYVKTERKRDEHVVHSATVNINKLKLWHRRLGHLNIKDLVTAKQQLELKGIKDNLKLCEFECETCDINKITRAPFPTHSNRTTEVLDIVHTDVCGPMRVESIGRAKYFVTLIDDCSRWCEVRFVSSKAQVFKEITGCIAKLEKQSGRKVKSIQSDNGTEYVNSDFDNYCQKRGIMQRLTVPYNPQQNGIAERKNRTLVEMARCMLNESGLPERFWAEAINTANYIRNRVPSKSLNGKTPYHEWYKKAPNVNYFKTFGSEVIYLEQIPAKSKFAAKGLHGIFLGYDTHSKGYRIWSTVHNKLIISRDIKIQHELSTKTGTVDIGPIISQRELLEFPPPDDREQHDIIEDKPDSTEQQTSRGRGRPQLLKTGKPGRPRKVYKPGIAKEQVMIPDTAELNLEEETMLGEISLSQALCHETAPMWYAAIDDEFQSLLRYNTWSIVDKPQTKKIIGCRLILRNKYNEDGSLSTRKARLVAQGCGQIEGIHYNETFAPVTRMSTIRLLTAIAMKENMCMMQFDVTTAYLNSTLKEDIFMTIPTQLNDSLVRISTNASDTRIAQKAKEMLAQIKSGNKVCKLQKSLYGLRQAGRNWYEELAQVLQRCGANPTNSDPCLYTKGTGVNQVYLAVYVDDIVIASKSKQAINLLHRQIAKQIKIKDLQQIHYCLGVEFIRKGNSMTLTQQSYVKDILSKYNMLECKPVSTPLEPGLKLPKGASHECDTKLPYRELIGSLLYLAKTTRPDLSYAIGYLSQFNHCYTSEHWTAAKRVLRYLRGTIDYGLSYVPTNQGIQCYSDADWGSNNVDRHSFTGFLIKLHNCVISWESRKQKTVALSTTEAEYIAISEAVKEYLYWEKVLNDLNLENLTKGCLYSDSNNALELLRNPKFHGRSKHMEIRQYFLRDILREGKLQFRYMPSSRQPADMLTKSVPKHRLEYCRKECGIVCLAKQSASLLSTRGEVKGMCDSVNASRKHCADMPRHSVPHAELYKHRQSAHERKGEGYAVEDRVPTGTHQREPSRTRTRKQQQVQQRKNDCGTTVNRSPTAALVRQVDDKETESQLCGYSSMDSNIHSIGVPTFVPEGVRHRGVYELSDSSSGWTSVFDIPIDGSKRNTGKVNYSSTLLTDDELNNARRHKTKLKVS